MSDTVQKELSPSAVNNNAALQQDIKVSEIDDTGRLRPIDSDAVAYIAASIAKDGLINPIDICQLPNQKSGQPYRLVAGGHRLAAFRLLGIETIPAFVRSNDTLGRKSREIAENFFKAELSPIDRAAFVAELIETEKARMGIASDQDGRALNKRQTPKELKDQLDNDLCILHKSFGIQEQVANKLGLEQSQVSRMLTIYRLPAAIVDRARALPIGTNASALRTLAKMSPSGQNLALDLLETGKARDITHAKAIMANKIELMPENKRLNAFLGAWSRMGKREREQALYAIASQAPKGWVIAKNGVTVSPETDDGAQ